MTSTIILRIEDGELRWDHQMDYYEAMQLMDVRAALRMAHFDGKELITKQKEKADDQGAV